jgi:glycosyltransferase involved in cell wall biosynthesis
MAAAQRGAGHATAEASGRGMSRLGAQPYFSILAAPHSAAALASVLDTVARQDFRSFEAVFIDDGSIANLSEALERDLRQARIFSVEQAAKPAEVWNRAADFARGSYLAFLEAGDVWHPRYLSYQNAVFESVPDALYSRVGYCNRDLAGEGFLPAAADAIDAPDEVLNMLASADLPTLSCLSVPRSLLLRSGGLDPRAGSHARIDFEIRLLGGLRSGGRLACEEHPAPRVPQILVLRRLAQEADDMKDTLGRWSSDLPAFIGNLFEQPFMQRFRSHRDWFEARYIERHCAMLRSVEASLRVAA